MTDPNQPIHFPVLIRFAKTGLMRFIGHLDWQDLQQSIFIRSGLPTSIGEGPTHKLKIKTSPPTPVGVESFTELTFLGLSEAIYPDEAKRRLDKTCPDGISVIFCRDAGRMVTKNPFGKIEAASYTVNFGDGVTSEQLDNILNVLEKVKDDVIPDGIDPEDVKKFWGRIYETRCDGPAVTLMVKQLEGDTFHAAQCAGFLEKYLGLPNYPIFSKLNYYRLSPSKRKLFS